MPSPRKGISEIHLGNYHVSGLGRKEVGKQGRIPYSWLSSQYRALLECTRFGGSSNLFLIYSTCACSMQDASVSVFFSEKKSVWGVVQAGIVIKCISSPSQISDAQQDWLVPWPQLYIL